LSHFEVEKDPTLIISFADKETEDIFNGVSSKKARKRLHSVLWEKTQTKLDMLNRAHRLDDLKVPPNNRLEKLNRDLSGKHSIRVNDQYIPVPPQRPQ
jgi:proteic killer suppression protein